jgi:hypothetical protein
MSPSLSELPAGERAELAMALWESLSEAEREGEFDRRPRRLRSWIGAGWSTFSGLTPRFHGTMSAAG